MLNIRTRIRTDLNPLNKFDLKYGRKISVPFSTIAAAAAFYSTSAPRVQPSAFNQEQRLHMGGSPLAWMDHGAPGSNHGEERVNSR